MGEMIFPDGVLLNTGLGTDGPRRVERGHDGYYVVGQGILHAVNSPLDGYRMIKELNDLARARRIGEVPKS